MLTFVSNTSERRAVTALVFAGAIGMLVQMWLGSLALSVGAALLIGGLFYAGLVEVNVLAEADRR